MGSVTELVKAVATGSFIGTADSLDAIGSSELAGSLGELVYENFGSLINWV